MHSIPPTTFPSQGRSHNTHIQTHSPTHQTNQTTPPSSHPHPSTSAETSIYVLTRRTAHTYEQWVSRACRADERASEPAINMAQQPPNHSPTLLDATDSRTTKFRS
ncbi:hypothetical protein BKA81DRAFT_362588 [Phyllosticta paracitricarpa]